MGGSVLTSYDIMIHSDLSRTSEMTSALISTLNPAALQSQIKGALYSFFQFKKCSIVLFFWDVSFLLMHNNAVCESSEKFQQSQCMINGVIISKKKELILNSLKRAISNSGLTSCMNI